MAEGWWARTWARALSGEPGIQPKPMRWNSLKRHVFRFSFCYYAVWITLNGNATIWEAVPGIGHGLQGWLWQPLGDAAQWIGRSLFRLHGPEAHWISRGTSDSALALTLTGCYVLLALLGAALWSWRDRSRDEYQTLFAWLRFALRLTVGIGLLHYGLAKLLPAGGQPLDQAALNAQLGSLSPAMVLWTASKASRGLQITEGLCELLAGAMLLYRRTALFSALLTFFGLATVLVAETYFRMPVRIFTGHLLLADGSIILPDLAMVVRFFWSHEWAAPSGIWIAPQARRSFFRGTATAEFLLVVLVLAQVVSSGISRFNREQVARSHPLPLLGGWTIQALPGAGTPLVSKSGEVITSVWFDRQSGRDMLTVTLKAAGGELWEGSSHVDLARNTLLLRGRYTAPRTYQLHWHGLNAVLLVAEPAPGTQRYADETLSRIDTPKQYRLLQKTPALVDSYGYSR